MIPCRIALFFVLAASALHAQVTDRAVLSDAATPATTTQDGPPGIVPIQKGFNLSLLTSSQHDSSNGWSSLLTPNLAYRFSSHFSADAGTPIFDYINVLRSVTTGTGTRAVTTTTNVTRHFAPADTTVNGHYQASPRFFDYELTATLGLPTGSKNEGLGAGKVTYDFDNSFEHSYGRFSPSIDIGIGDSSSLNQTRIRKSYTTVGTLANLQAGTSIDLPHSMSFSASAYENLPLTNQTLYSTTGRGKKKKTNATTVSAEDNGFQTSLDVPLNGHVTLSGYYNRSLRSHIDTAGFSLLFLLRAHPTNAVH